MAEILDSFPEKIKAEEKYKQFFDGKVYKINPEEFDYNMSSIKAFISALNSAAKKNGCYIRNFVTLDNHVIIQRRPDNYIPRKINRKVKE